MVATLTAIFPLVFHLDDYARGPADQPSPSQYHTFLQLQITSAVPFWVCVYAVKYSFLMLYRMLFVVQQLSSVIWWSVAIFTMETFWVCIAGELTTCGPSQNLLKEGTPLGLLSLGDFEAHLGVEYYVSKAGERDRIIVLMYSGVIHVLSGLISR